MSFLAFGLLPITSAPAAPSQIASGQNALVDILSSELDRNFAVLKAKADPPPYFISYSVTEQEAETVSASLGSLNSRNRSHKRLLDVSVRVGTPQLDNYRRVRGDLPQFTAGAVVTLDDAADAIKRRVWSETDRVYRLASQRLLNVKTNQQGQVELKEDAGDFGPAPKAVSFSSVPPLKFKGDDWQTKLRKWSTEFGNKPGILASSITVVAQRETKTLVNTEGTRIQHGRTFARLIFGAQAKAADGMDLASSEILDAEDASRFPDEKVVKATMAKVERDLLALLQAPVVEPYVGPAILSGRASGVFFHEIFGHRIEGHRQKDESEGQTFAKSVGAKILPEFLSVTFDATKRSLDGTDLNGWYEYDDEGVKARPVTIVDQGILRNFLLSRSPLSGFAGSNGHGRRQPGREVVPRQSNLIVSSTNRVTTEQLRAQLLAELKKQNKPYGLYFEKVDSGYTTTGRRGLQAFTVIPQIVYRIYADGRPDEMVRGADIVGTPLSAFAKIAATSDKTEIFNGVCGAESGSVPVSATSPAIFVSEVEIQKKERSQDRPPILPSPNGGRS
jgi:predicted Zn-dependent protease